MTEQERLMLKEKLKAAKAEGKFDQSSEPKASKTSKERPAVRRVRADNASVRPVVPVEQVDSEDYDDNGSSKLFGVIPKALLVYGGFGVLVLCILLFMVTRFLGGRKQEVKKEPVASTAEAPSEATTAVKAEEHPDYTNFLEKYVFSDKGYETEIKVGDKTAQYQVASSGSEVQFNIVSGDKSVTRYSGNGIEFMSVGTAEPKWYQTKIEKSADNVQKLEDITKPSSVKDYLATLGIVSGIYDKAKWAYDEEKSYSVAGMGDNTEAATENSKDNEKSDSNERKSMVDVLMYEDGDTSYSYYISRDARSLDKIVVKGKCDDGTGQLVDYVKTAKIESVHRIETSEQMPSSKELAEEKFINHYKKCLSEFDPVILSLIEPVVVSEPVSEQKSEEFSETEVTTENQKTDTGSEEKSTEVKTEGSAEESTTNSEITVSTEKSEEESTAVSEDKKTQESSEEGQTTTEKEKTTSTEKEKQGN